jgi:hypothetical protein
MVFLTPLSTIFQLYRGGLVCWSRWRKPGKNTNLWPFTDKLYHIICIGYTSSERVVFELTTSVVIDTDWTCSCNSNYHTITAMMALKELYYIMLYRVHLVWAGFELTTLVVIVTDWTGSCKSNYHTWRCTNKPTAAVFINVVVYKLFFMTTIRQPLHIYVIYCDIC